MLTTCITLQHNSTLGVTLPSCIMDDWLAKNNILRLQERSIEIQLLRCITISSMTYDEGLVTFSLLFQRSTSMASIVTSLLAPLVSLQPVQVQWVKSKELDQHFSLGIK